MTHPIEITSADAVASLRMATRTGSAAADEHLVDGVYFSWDAEQAEINMDVASEMGGLFDATVSVSGAPRWFSFNIGLGDGAFQPGNVLGIVMDLQGENLGDLSCFVRTARGGDLLDTHIVDTIPVTSERGVVTVLHWVTQDDPLCGDEAYHTFVLSLPAHDFSWKLNDLRVFIVPSEPSVDG